MTLNPFGLIARAFYAPFKGSIIAAWNAARADAFTEIRSGLPSDADLTDVNSALAEMRQARAAIEDDEPKRRGKK